MVETKIIITMTLDQAIWLKGLMQNPFCGKSSKLENKQDSTNRRFFWDELKEGQ